MTIPSTGHIARRIRLIDLFAAPPIVTSQNHNKAASARALSLSIHGIFWAMTSGRAIGLDRRRPGIARRLAKLFLDPQQLVVLRRPIRPRQAASLDLSAAERDREIGDGRILGLARPVAHHRGIARR